VVAKSTSKKSLSEVVKTINKDSPGLMATLSEDELMGVSRIPTGILSLDIMLNGGIPRGTIVETFGKPGGAKSCIATMLAGQAQQFGEVVYIDLENAFDPKKAENSGVNLKKLWIPQPGSAEETLSLIEKCLEADDVSLIVIDSTAAMVTRAEINGDYGDAHVAQLARLMSSGLKKVNQFMVDRQSQTIIFFVNQIREMIGGYGMGPTTYTPGGKALPFYSSTRLEVSRTGQLKQGEEVIGQSVQVKNPKSRFSPPFQKCNFDLYYDSGVSNESSIVDAAVKLGYLDKGSSGWYSDVSTGEKIGHGKPKVLAYLDANPDYAKELTKKVLT